MSTQLINPITLQEMVAQSRLMDDHKRDERIFNHAVKFEGDNTLNLIVGGDDFPVAYPVAQSARPQLVTKIKPRNMPQIPTRYFDCASPALQAAMLNEYTRELSGNRQWFGRFYRDELRAWLSPTYAPIPNTDVLQIASDFVDDAHGTAYKLVRPRLDANAMYAKVTVADTDGGNFAIGFVVSNDEIGGGSLSVEPFIQRHSCTNSTVWAQNSLRMTHQYHHVEAMKTAVADAIATAIQAAPEMVAKVAIAARQVMPSFRQVVDTVVKDHNLSQADRDLILMGTEGEHTRMGLVNGISYAAHATDHSTEKTRRLERLAGSWLMSAVDEINEDVSLMV